VTAHGDYYNEKAIEAGCREVVAKPVDLESLTGIVERYLKDEKDVEDPQNNFFAAD
jgi:DNA-binding NtrC family response regulator